jgi:hypothetical protein
MFCEGSQEEPYSNDLEAAASFSITGDLLSITLNNSAGVMTFRKN